MTDKFDKDTGEVLGLPKLVRWFEIPEEVPSCSGSKDYTLIDWKFSEQDKCFIPVVGKTIDLYNAIQLHKSSTDLGAIIARVNAGDITALNVRTGEYMDVTQVPRSLNEMAAFQARIDKSWDSLDPKVKELFDNDLDKFTNSLINNELSKTINDYIEKNKVVVNDKKVEVNENV